MALPPLTSSDVGAAARSKINAGFAATDANTAAIAAEATARSTADGVLSKAITDEATARGAAELELGRRIESAYDSLNAYAQFVAGKFGEVYNALEHAATKDELSAVRSDLAVGVAGALRFALAVISEGGRPGLAPGAFSASATESLLASAPLDPAGAVTTPFGPAYRIAGAGLIAPRASVPVDPDTITVLRLGYSRITDVLDPNNNAIDIGLQWLDRAGAEFDGIFEML